MNQNADPSLPRRSSLNTDEYAYRSCHPSAPGGVGISNGLGNRSAMMFLLGYFDGCNRVCTILVIGSAVQVAAGRARRLHTVSGRLCSSSTSPEAASMAHSTSCGH